MGCDGIGRLGLLDSGAGGHRVGPHLYALLVLLARLRRILPLDEGLLDGPSRVPGRDAAAAFEGPRAGATGAQQKEQKPGNHEAGQKVQDRRTPPV